MYKLALNKNFATVIDLLIFEPQTKICISIICHFNFCMSFFLVIPQITMKLLYA